MSTDNNGKSNGLLANPLPIVMVALLAAGVLVKNVPLESARPIDPESVKFMMSTQQDVGARLWQDPFAAVEKHEERLAQAEKSAHIKALHNRIQKLISHNPDSLTIVAVNVFGDAFDEAAELRRRSRFAVVSALEFHHYHPEEADAIGYIQLNVLEPGKPEPPESEPGRPKPPVIVPYEWFEGEKQINGESLPSNVLVLWVNESRFLDSLNQLYGQLFSNLTSSGHKSLKVKMVGPAGSGGLAQLVKWKKIVPNTDNTLQVFSPGATISNCKLFSEVKGREEFGECFTKNSDHIKTFNDLGIVRTIGTDDVLASALLWELWQRDVNREFGYDHSWWQPKRAQLTNNAKSSSPERRCKDGLVLISELDSRYARSLSQYLSDGFLSLCGINSNGTDTIAAKPVRTFTYLRGLDGALPDSKKPDNNAPRKDNNGKSKDLRAYLKDVPLEHAEGLSQYDYLRRLADEIERLDKGENKIAENGTKAIGIVGSDLYDKLLILQALRSRFKDKIFFTTDLDARYLHADQKDWARNLVVASNFGLSLRPELQQSALPFRDGYQTAIYLATLMALQDGKEATGWNDKMKEWLHPQVFEIGRTEAVHLASPTVKDLTAWYKTSKQPQASALASFVSDPTAWCIDSGTEGFNPKGIICPKEKKKEKKVNLCDQNWAECKSIDPARQLPMPSFKYWREALVIIFFGVVLCAMASCRVRETFLAVKDALSPPLNAKAKKIFLTGVGLLVIGGLMFAYIKSEMHNSLKLGIGEPFVWFEGVSVWPSLVIRFMGLALTLLLALALWFRIWQKSHIISRHFNFVLPKTWKLERGRWSAICTGPYVDLTSFNMEGMVSPKPVGSEVEITTLWQNYLRVTNMREMKWWIMSSTAIVFLFLWMAFQVFDKPSFPHRGQFVEILHIILVLLNALILWLVIFWVSYQTRACAQFIKVLSITSNSLWPTELLKRKEKSTGVPREYLANYLDFELVRRVTQRIQWLIYLPFVLILFMVIARSDLFDAMNFPLILIVVVGLMLVYALGSEVLLRKGAIAARTTKLDYYAMLLLRAQAAPKINLDENEGSSSSLVKVYASIDQAQLKSNPPLTLARSKPPGSTEPPISTEQIKLLMEHIRNTRDGVFAPIYEQPALRALLLPFGGFGGAQLIEYLMRLTV